MGQKKLIRFAEMQSFENVLQFPQDMAGNWAVFFGNSHPVTLELACGKGEYALGLARLYPERNFLGVDIKGNRLWVGAKKAAAERLRNAGFLRTQIELLPTYFNPGEVAEIWITFPDPQLRFSKAKKRLTHPRFLRLYRQVLQPGGKVHLKTDSPDLYQFTKEVIARYHCNLLADESDLYKKEITNPELKIKTYYESLDIAQSSRIHYLCFTLPDDLGGTAEDAQLKEAIRYELDRGGALLL